jgi:Amt family ammonium transporter
MVGASLLWVGWFGFNAGSALEAGNGSAGAGLHQHLFATAAGGARMDRIGEALMKGKASMLGAASGAVAGLVAITPAAGFVGPMGAIVIGFVAGSPACGASTASRGCWAPTTRSTCSACTASAASSARC